MTVIEQNKFSKGGEGVHRRAEKASTDARRCRTFLQIPTLQKAEKAPTGALTTKQY
jgi:hypothetical protein